MPHLVTPDVLAEPDDAQLMWRAVEPAWNAVSIYDGPTRFAADLAPLTPGQRGLLALNWLASEVYNGGFEQLFDNPTRVVVPEALAGARLIGATRTAELIDAAARAYGGARPRGHKARGEADALNEDFYAAADSEMYPRGAAYVRAHPVEFAAGVAPGA